MNDLLERIDWTIDTIRNQEKFGLDDLNAALSRERRAKATLIETKKKLKQLNEYKDLLDRFMNIDTYEMSEKELIQEYVQLREKNK